MDPINIIVTALILGAAAGMKDTAEQVIKDAYISVKDIIRRKYAQVSLDVLENNPSSEARQAVVKEDLERANADQDEELLQKATVLVEVVLRNDPSTAIDTGVDLEAIKGASLRISDIIASGTGVHIRDADISGDIEIEKVRAGRSREDSSKKA